ncbi:hypothetical protein G7Y79_00042g078650 [Physcia stellaris]|nr:hypothetical protein G7Y79_00042g078650 [Physcia stellaris]
MSQKPFSDLTAEAAGGKNSAFEPGDSSIAPAALPRIQEETRAAEGASQTGAQITALTTNLEENRQEHSRKEAAVSETYNTKAQAAESDGTTTKLSAEGQLEEVYQQQSDAAALIEQNPIVDLPSSSLDYDQLHTAPTPAVEPEPVRPQSTSSSETEIDIVREISLEPGRMTVDRRDELNRPWRIPQVGTSQFDIDVEDLLTVFAIVQRRQNEEQRQPQVSRPPADRRQLQSGELTRYPPATLASGPVDHTPTITGPPAGSITHPGQSAQPALPAPYNPYIMVIPNVSTFPPSRSVIPPPNPYFNYPHSTPSAAPSNERRIFPRWNQTTAHPLNAPIPTRLTPTFSTHSYPLQPTALATTPASASTSSNAPMVPADPEEALRMGWPVVTLGDICPCNLDGHHCMLPVRCRYLKNKICTKKDCNCNAGKPASEHKHHTKATCNSIREGRPCDFGGYGHCWFGHDAPGETARVDQARIHRAHHQGDI